MVSLALHLHSTLLLPGLRCEQVMILVCSNPNLPRALRARVGATTDPVPKGKHIDAEPRHDAITTWVLGGTCMDCLLGLLRTPVDI